MGLGGGMDKTVGICLLNGKRPKGPRFKTRRSCWHRTKICECGSGSTDKELAFSVLVRPDLHWSASPCRSCLVGIGKEVASHVIWLYVCHRTIHYGHQLDTSWQSSPRCGARMCWPCWLRPVVANVPSLIPCFLRFFFQAAFWDPIAFKPYGVSGPGFGEWPWFRFPTRAILFHVACHGT